MLILACARLQQRLHHQEAIGRGLQPLFGANPSAFFYADETQAEAMAQRLDPSREGGEGRAAYNGG